MSERGNSVWGLRLMSVGMALLLWIFVSLEHRGERPAEKVVDAGVTYNPPTGMIILNPVEEVRVRLRGSERRIRSVNPYLVDVQVELEEAKQGLVDVQLNPENVLTPEGIEVVSVEPSYLRLQVEPEVKRLLPVRPEIVGEPAAGAVVAGRPQVRPPQVLASGPANLLAEVDFLETSPISLDGHALDFEETTLVLSPNPLIKIVGSQVVTVTVPMRQPGPVPRPDDATRGAQ